MQTTDAVTLFDYLYWARDAVLRAAAQLSDDEFTSTDTVTTRDLRATLVHELDVQWSWRERLKGADWEEWGDDADLDAHDYPTLHSLREHWLRDEGEMRAWLAILDNADLEAPPSRDEVGRNVELELHAGRTSMVQTSRSRSRTGSPRMTTLSPYRTNR